MKSKFLVGTLLVFMTAMPVVCASYSPKGCLEADIIFVLDKSDSVAGYESFIAGAVSDFIGDIELDDAGIKVGLVAFNSNVAESQRLTSDKEALATTLALFEKTGASGGTAATQAFILSSVYFTDSKKERGSSVMRIIIFISDGYLGDKEETAIQTDWLKDKYGVVIFSINVADWETYHGKDVLQGIATDSTHYFQADYGTLNATIKSMDLCM